MTDVAPKTAEINDAVFCLTHFKEVVRPDIRHHSKILILIMILIIRLCLRPCALTVHRLRRRPAGGKRWLLRGTHDTYYSLTTPDTPAPPRFAPQFDFIDREGIEAPATGQNKDNVYQCKKHSSDSTSPVSPLPPFSCFALLDPYDKKLIDHFLFCFVFPFLLR